MIPCLHARIKPLLFISLLLLGLFSCKKDLKSVGADFVGARNGFNTQYDTTMDLTAYTVAMDTVATSKLTSYALGAFYDPEFGIRQGSIVTQFSLPQTASFTWTLGSTKLDSVVMLLKFRNEPKADGTYQPDYYGDPDAVHTLEVYRLTEDLSVDSAYYSHRVPAYDPTPIGRFTGKYNFVDSTYITLKAVPQILLPHIRIKMTDAFRDELFAAQDKGNFVDIPAFKNAYKGFVVVDKTFSLNPGSVVFIRLNSDVTSLTAYQDSNSFVFPFSATNEAAYNYYQKFNTPADRLQPFNIKPDSAKHRDICYVEALGGSKVHIEIPHLFDGPLRDSKLTINGAEIVFPVAPGTFNDPYKLPDFLLLYGSDSIGKNILSLDQVLESATYTGGTFNTNYNEYRFNIARQLQYMLDQHKHGLNINYGFNLNISHFAPVSAQRVIINTAKNTGRFKLKLTYTVIK